VVVLDWGPGQGALAVDALLGQTDVLIERVAAPVGAPPWLGGATILADGSPAFVLDPTALF
jgi:chemotaxis protein histidine kinase CheA